MRRSLFLPLLFLGCSSSPPDSAALEVAGTTATEPRILGGTPSDDAQNAVVMLVVVDPATSRRLGVCTAAMVAPNLALTARHCVSRSDGQSIACDADGSALFGGQIQSDYSPEQIYVFTGKDRPALVDDDPLDLTKWRPAGQGAEIISDRAPNLCNHDIALVRLKAPIANNPIAAVRLDGGARTNEKLTTVGWGVTSQAPQPAQRQTRTGVNVKRVGPSSAIPVLTSSEFLFDESICLGDSGGPIFDAESGAIVGVVSRGGNGETPSDTDYARTCVNADNLGTSLSSFKPLVNDAFSRAGATARLEAGDEDSGCNGSGRSPATGTLLLAGIGALFARRRRG